MGGVQAEHVQTDCGSVGASSSAAGQYASGKEMHEELEHGCLEVDTAHSNVVGFCGGADGLYEFSTVGAELCRRRRRDHLGRSGRLTQAMLKAGADAGGEMDKLDEANDPKVTFSRELQDKKHMPLYKLKNDLIEDIEKY